MVIKNLETPALYVDMNVLERNVKLMRDFVTEKGVALRPHYKSNKCTAIAHLQIKNGAKGITCAKLSEAEDLILSGVEDVLIANQVTDPAKAARLAYLAGCCHLTVCVDSEEHCQITKEGVTEKIGDRLALIPGHCCTAVNIHDWLYMVRDDKVVDRVPINSRGRSL